MKTVQLRNAFSMVTAIFIIVIMATVAAFVMNLGGKIVKSTTMQYQHEQAELYAKSYTEFAVLAVTGNNRTAGNCLKRIQGSIGTPSNGQGYRIRTLISYIGPAAIIGTCPATRQLSTAVTTVKTPLTVIIDVYVDYKDPDNTGAGTPWFTVHRRTVQKI